MNDKQRAGGFLDRWSARKRQAVQDGDAPDTRFADGQPELKSSISTPVGEPSDGLPVPVVPVHSLDKEGQQQAQRSAEPALLTDDDMPPVESLSVDSDLSDFFNKGVSAALRKAALRHVFQQPQFNIRDGLNDYDGDYTVFEPLGDTITSDMKWHIARKERERLEAEALALQEQERLALEKQALDYQEPEVGESDEQAATETEVEVPVQQSSQDEHDIIRVDAESLSEQVPIPDESHPPVLAAESALNLVTDDAPALAPAPARVAGKLRRIDGHALRTDNTSRQLADAGPGNESTAQDHEE